MLQNPGNTKVSNLNLISLGHEDVLGFQISMQNLAIMNMLYSQSHLNEPVKDLIFRVHYYNTKLRLISQDLIQK